ncbi:lipopolysaccharide biosynthesis protein [Cycloclasticus pugetii]|uniref:lipopolysaccharide biosynthesis protein n=1 Tax=Cycloclasticus pugetii TaxID=34068 RepID=UPI00037AABE4|nr:oligosaccharide flippase family protein [Cycloclasticus pugetii]
MTNSTNINSDPYTKKNVRHNALHYLFGRGAAGLAGFLTVILLVRVMDIEDYAAYIALSGLATMCGILADLGMGRLVARYVPEGRIHRTAHELSHFIWTVSIVKFLVTIIIVILLAILWPSVDKIFASIQFNFFSIGLACLIISEALFQYFSAVLQALVMQKTLTRLLTIQWAGRLVLITIILFEKDTLSWEDVLWVFAVPEMLGVVVFLLVIFRYLKQLASSEEELSVVSKEQWPVWSQVTKVALNNYGFMLLAAPPQGYFMKMVTASYLPVDIVAAYGFFISLVEKFRQYIPLHFFYALIEPIMIANYLKNRDFSILRYRCKLLYKSNLLLMVPAIVWTAVSGYTIVEFMTNGKFQGLSWILVLIMVQLTIGSHMLILQLILNSVEKSRLLVKAGIRALVIMIIAMAVSVNTNAIYLLFTPLLFSLAMNFYIVFSLSRSDYSYEPTWNIFIGIILPGIIALIFTSWMLDFIPWGVDSIFGVILSLSSVLSVYSLIIWWMKTIELSEVNIIKSFIFAKKN